MGTFYLDIETTGLNPQIDAIITIQYQELDRTTGQPKGELIILKSWESSEKDIIHNFLSETSILEEYDFSFVCVGYNLGFEHKFLKERARKYNLTPLKLLGKPFIDLRTIGIIMNQGEFKGSGLDQITGKEKSGRSVPIWFENREYDKITNYVTMEAKEFIKFNTWLHKKLPKLREEFNAELMAQYEKEAQNDS